MSLKTEWISYGKNKEFLGYAAWPERVKKSLPAVLVFQEIWGLDAHIEDVTRRFAQAGYLAFAPDLYVSEGVRPAAIQQGRVAELQELINQLPPEVWSSVLMDPKAREAHLNQCSADKKARLVETMNTLFAALSSGGLKLEEYLPPVLAASQFLHQDFKLTAGNKVFAVGFCMGGGLAGLLACYEPKLAAAAIFYGSAPAESLLPKIQCPVAGFYGSQDKRLVDALPAFTEAMKKAGKSFESHIYEGAAHAFFNDTRPVYDVNATRQSFARVLEFFNSQL